MAILLDFNQAIIASVAVMHAKPPMGMKIPNAIHEDMTDDELEEAKLSYESSFSMIRHVFLNSLLTHKKKFGKKYGDFVICCDSPHSWRKDVFPYYKAHRKKGRDESSMNWDFAFYCIKTLKQELNDFFPYKVVEYDGAEGDDVIAILTKYYQDNELVQVGLIEEPQPIMIMSSDKDFKQLQIFAKVDQYSPTLKKHLRENRPDLFLKEHIIRGDSGDGVPNFLSDDDVFVMKKRQKPVRTTKLEVWLEQDENEICNGDDQLLHNYKRNKTLIDLLNSIPSNVESGVLENYKSAHVEPRSALLNYFIKNRLKNLMEEITEF